MQCLTCQPNDDTVFRGTCLICGQTVSEHVVHAELRLNSEQRVYWLHGEIACCGGKAWLTIPKGSRGLPQPD